MDPKKIKKDRKRERKKKERTIEGNKKITRKIKKGKKNCENI